MRIGFDVAQTCAERAGCAWYADSLARALAPICGERGDELILYHHFGDWLNLNTASGTVIDAPHVSMPLRRLDAEKAGAVWTDPADPRLGRPDLVHANSFRSPHVAGARLVFTIYDVSFWTVPQFTTDANRLACQRGVFDAMKRADGFLFISNSARDEFERILPGWIAESGMPTAVVHLGPRARHPQAALPASVDGEFWLAVGTLEPRKNYEVLLDALILYRARSAAPRPLVIVGGGGWKSEDSKRRLAALQDQGAVRALGYVSDMELSALYARASALIFPSWYEGFGLPVLEAMAHACPVISSDRTSLREVGGDAARYVDPASAESIASAMLAMEAEDPAPLRAAAQRQATSFSWEKAARETLSFYRTVLAAKKARFP